MFFAVEFRVSGLGGWVRFEVPPSTLLFTLNLLSHNMVRYPLRPGIELDLAVEDLGSSLNQGPSSMPKLVTSMVPA